MTDPSETTRRLYGQLFGGGATDRIPLIASPPCPGHPAMHEFPGDPAGYVRRAAQALAPKIEAGGNWIPSVAFVWHQCIAVPSLYGARVVDVAGSVPVPEPVFESAREGADAVRAESSAVVDEMVETLKAALDALPDGFALGASATSSPFDLAQMLVPGATFATDLYTDPEACEAFLFALTDACIDMVRLVREYTDSRRDDPVTIRGYAFPGLRLPGDAIVNYSPDLLRRFVLPCLERLGEAFGSLCIHYCTHPAPSGHVLGPLVECEAVRAVDVRQGYEAILGEICPAREQSRVALVFDADFRTEGAMKALLDCPSFGTVRRPAIVNTPADSVEDARRIYAEWRERTA